MAFEAKNLGTGPVALQRFLQRILLKMGTANPETFGPPRKALRENVGPS